MFFSSCCPHLGFNTQSQRDTHAQGCPQRPGHEAFANAAIALAMGRSLFGKIDAEFTQGPVNSMRIPTFETQSAEMEVTSESTDELRQQVGLGPARAVIDRAHICPVPGCIHLTADLGNHLLGKHRLDSRAAGDMLARARRQKKDSEQRLLARQREAWRAGMSPEAPPGEPDGPGTNAAPEDSPPVPKMPKGRQVDFPDD